MEKSVAERDVAPLCLHSFIFATLVNCRVRIQAQGAMFCLTVKQQKTAEQTSTQEVSKENAILETMITDCKGN